ncbi:MAG: hypothetical protein ABSE77_13555 [Acidimicrobiales bacterium]
MGPGNAPGPLSAHALVEILGRLDAGCSGRLGVAARRLGRRQSCPERLGLEPLGGGMEVAAILDSS